MPKKNDEYRVPNLELTPVTTTLNTQTRQASDVAAEFSRISKYADLLAANDGPLFAEKRRFRYTHVNRKGINEAKNHFQGIQRLKRGKYCVISGADTTEPASHCFVVRMDSRVSDGPWGSNILHSRRPGEGDGVVRTIPLDNKLWHAGGMSVLGDVLAIPIEGANRSKVVFLHMADPETPTRIDCEIDRPNIPKAGATALATLLDGRYVCAVWREVSANPGGRLDFHVSESPDLHEGFVTKSDGTSRSVMWKYDSLGLADGRNPAYQSVNFIEPADKDAGNGRSKLYLVCTENGSRKAPLGKGPDIADLFEVVFPNDFLLSNDALPEVARMNSRQFFGDQEHCNFAAAAGVYIDPTAGLSLYSAYHWRSNDLVQMTEFRGTPDPQSVITENDKAWIELYEDRDFSGRRLSILGRHDAEIPDYGKISVQGIGYDDRVTSIRYQLPTGMVYRLYRGKGFAGGQPGEDFIDLIGTGRLSETADLGSMVPKLENQVSSSKYV